MFEIASGKASPHTTINQSNKVSIFIIKGTTGN